MERKVSNRKFAEMKQADKEAGIRKGQKRTSAKGEEKRKRNAAPVKEAEAVKTGEGSEGAKRTGRTGQSHRRGNGTRNASRSQNPSYLNYKLDDNTSIGENESRIEGRNAVTEAFRSGRTVDRLYVLDGCQDGAVNTIKREAAKAGTPIKYVSRDRLDQMSETGSHQGVIAVLAAYHYSELEDLFALAEERNEDPFFILLDNIEDPHNLGAIIRTANIVGAHGVIIPKDRAVGLTATVAKASAGAINYTPVVKVTNLSATIDELKERGLWFVCADMGGTPMTKLNLAGAIGLVIGNEGDGVSRLVKEKCDIIASIPQKGQINSLNASVAMGVLSYEILRQREM